jgi:quercetin dioxygenase-like cupin family protein
MIRGWFVGPFEPTLLNTEGFEVAVKCYSAGDSESTHHHRVATEITVIVSGSVEMCGQRWSAGDIVVLEPGEASAFRAITDAINVVVKVPGVPGDKYPGLPEESVP